MADTQKEAAAGGGATFEMDSLLDAAIGATKQTEPEYAQDLLKTLTEQAMAGTVVFNKSLNATLKKAMSAIDAKMSKQLAAIMHHPRFLQLEGSWRGLKHLVFTSETGPMLKIKVLNITKRQLLYDF
jgi:type VI secretion system protein ImpC